MTTPPMGLRIALGLEVLFGLGTGLQLGVCFVFCKGRMCGRATVAEIPAFFGLFAQR